MLINNLLVVRFSLRSPEWARLAYGDESNRSRWFDFRFEIFRNFLLRSLRNGVEPKGLYLLMDESDSLLYEKFRPIMPCYLVPIFSIANNHYDQVETHVRSLNLQNIAISRVDSDDCLAPGYLDSINKCIEEALLCDVDFSYVIAPIGIRANNSDFQFIHYPNSPFLTLFSKSYMGQNIYGINHENVLNYSYLICSSAYWLQTVNGTNVSNSLLDSQLTNEKFFDRVKSDNSFFASNPNALNGSLPFQLQEFLPILNSFSAFDA